MDTLLWLIQNYGYAIVFIWTFLEGETIVALAGFAAYQGYLRLEYIIPIAIVGAMLGDHAFFYFGRYKGRQFLAKHSRLNEKAERIHLLVERYHGWIIFGSRFMYGFRTIIPIALGVGRVSGLKFFFFNFLGAVVWAVLFAFGGYVFGNAAEYFLGNVKKIEGFFVLGLVAIALIAQVVMWWGRRRNERLLTSVSPADSPNGKIGE
ncbi:MAG: DedA family protein [bacterium]|nr:DedA family protein [bacterium]